MRIYTKIELENKVGDLTMRLHDPLTSKEQKSILENQTKYYINKLAELDQTPNQKTIKA